MPTLTYAAPDDPLLKTLLIRGIEMLSGGRRLQSMYATATEKSCGTESEPFWSAALRQLGIRLSVTSSSERDTGGLIPADGPTLVVANHPYGIVDGLALCHLVTQSRPDLRILINGVLCRDDRFADHFLPVDFSETRNAARTNMRSMRKSLSTLQGGGVLAMFPAGGIATSERPFGPVTDLPWKPFAAHLVEKTDAQVVPVHFEGRNSRLFQVASAVSQTLRLSLIIREVIRMRGEELAVHVGAPLSNAELAGIGDREAITQYLHRQTFALGETN